MATATKPLKKGPSKTLPKTTTDKAVQSATTHPVNPFIAVVPPMSVADNYVGRTIHGISDMDMLDYAYENAHNVLIEGPTGPGKTMFTRAWAARRGLKVARIASNSGVDTSQLFGKYIPDPSGGLRWVDGPVPYVFRFGGVILWNEINFTPTRVGSIMFAALDAQREIILMDHDGEVLRAHLGAKNNCWCNLDPDDCDARRVLIVADQNPDYIGTVELNAALRNRFSMQVQWDYDPNVEARLVKSKALLNMVRKIRAQAEQAGFETPISTNMMIEFEKIAADLGVPWAMQNFISHFKAEERDPLKLVCEAESTHIEKDFAKPVPKQAAPDVDDDPEIQVMRDDAKSDDGIDLSDFSEWVFVDD